ncbi:hypothetical protein EDC96DRAFT_506965 [Choanephora cucurbitarum]|nr:hypothetical protein EDC96DRAFT_506965 [Choanephora cucurbitarum]
MAQMFVTALLLFFQNPKTKDSDNFIYLCMLKLFILIRVGLIQAIFSTFLRDDDKHMRQTRSGKQGLRPGLCHGH